MENVTDEDVDTIRHTASAYLERSCWDDPELRHQVEDMVQTVVENVTRQVAHGADIRNLAAYTTRAARNTLNGLLRKRQGRPVHIGVVDAFVERDLGELALDRTGASTSLDVIERESRARHSRIIAEMLGEDGPLNSTETQVLLLRHEEGRSSAEVADILGLAGPGSVDTIASRARKKLLDHLEGTSNTLYLMIARQLRADWA